MENLVIDKVPKCSESESAIQVSSAKKSTRYSRVLVVTELVVSGSQYIRK